MDVRDGMIPGVKIITPEIIEDSRGFFMECYNQMSLKNLGIDIVFVQDNHSKSTDCGVLRGLHYQLEPKTQTKLVRVIAGAVIDVVVDIRLNSPTFGEWEMYELSAKNKRQLLVPRGFAHGFCTIEPNTEVLYKVDEFYSNKHDRGIAWNDPAIGIQWPTSNPILSSKDESHPLLTMAEVNYIYEGVE